MRVVIRSLVRWAWIFIVCFIVGWLSGRQLVSALPPTYQATAVVHLDAQARSNPSGAPVVQSVAAYATMVTSDSILGAALSHYPDLNRQALSRQIVATPDLNGQNIMLAVTLPRPKEAASLANDLARLLVVQQNAAIKQAYAQQIKLLNATISAEQKQIDDLNQKIVQTPITNTTTIQQYQDQRSQIQSMQNQNVTARDNLLTQQALYSAPLSVIQTAAIPNRPSTFLGMVPLIPITILLMLILGGVLIFFLERCADRINSVYTLQKKVALPIFGTLNWSNPIPHEIPLRAFCELKHPYVEACRVMMADILFQAEQTHAHILAVTALKPRAGTSTVAAQLATLLAQSKRRVLLIDANLHQPLLHERFELDNKAETGLAHLLEKARMLKGAEPSSGAKPEAVSIIDQLPVGNFVIPTSLPNLFLLPAGRPSVNPTNLLSIPEMEQFLKWAKTRSDYIVIDCPSLAFAEVHALGSLCDQVFVVVDATKDRLQQVAQIEHELISSSVKLTGLIINKLNKWI